MILFAKADQICTRFLHGGFDMSQQILTQIHPFFRLLIYHDFSTYDKTGKKDKGIP